MKTILFGVLVFACAYTNAMPQIPGIKLIPAPKLLYLGIVGEKSYFIDATQTNITWDEAKTYCTSQGMELGTIETAAEVSFLKSKYSTIDGTGVRDYWIGARDVGTLDQFVWDKNQGKVQSVAALNYKPPRYNCLHMILTTATTLNFYSHICATPEPSIAVLCQIKSL